MPNLGDLIFALPVETKQEIRKLEKVFLKLNKTELSCAFNECCLRENILPKYTQIKLHDSAAKNEEFTDDFRRKLVERQLEENKTKLNILKEESSNQRIVVDKLLESDTLRENVFKTIETNVEKERQNTHRKMLKKLQNLYGGPILLPESRKCFLNLSKRSLSTDEEEFLNLGLNCHTYSKFDPYKKKLELELLYDNLLGLEKSKIIDINPNLKDQLRSESTKVRGATRSNIIKPHLKEAAKSLRDDESIVIRKADKSNMYVIMDKSEYQQKLNDILNDTSKFQQISKNPVDELKKKLYKITKEVNQKCGKKVFKEPVGDFEPGYIYGNVKTHKPGNKLRPIISQVTTPTYTTAKKLDELIKPYIPAEYMLKSRDEFLDILQTTQPKGPPSSLDVESLFTNVPVYETIEIIIRNVYHHKTLPPPCISREDLRELLILCTTSVPFRNVDGKLYIQKDGMSMGSPLGPTFANFYMADVENKVLNMPNMKPNIYCRYVDDIFTDADKELLLEIKKSMEEHSVLKFTYEEAQDGQLPFLDILTIYSQTNFSSKVYVKPTDNGICLNGKSECPERYKRTVVLSFVKRAWTTCTSYQFFLSEITRVKQVLVNNSYTNSLVDKVIKDFLQKVKSTPTPVEKDQIKQDIYYLNQMSTAYKVDEQVLRKIIKDNVQCKSSKTSLNLIIYYKNAKTKSMVMRNNLTRKKNRREIDQTNVIYEFKCPHDECIRQPVNNVYIGFTTCTVSRRLSLHLQNGAIKSHSISIHKEKMSRETIVENTKVKYREQNQLRLEVLESILILFEKPEINKQETGKQRKLSLFQ